MTSLTHGLRRVRRRRQTVDAPAGPVLTTPAAAAPSVDIAPNDPIIPFFQSAAGPVDIEHLELESPALDALRTAGTKIVVPLVSQGELIGLLNLGPRLSERDYSGDDRQLLATLAGYAAPAVRVGQLVREQEAEIRTRERLEQELRVAQLIQQQFLPKELPDLPSWHIAAFYKPARAVGGDFYDFIDLPDGKVGIVAGDVTDKGVPAALVMATVHSIMRAEAPRLVSPGKVLERANELLFPDIPSHMFVTCLYAVLDPVTGEFVFANAGHNLPYVRTAAGGVELRATGMPLGLMPGMKYEESRAVLKPGESMLLHSDGLAEAHSPTREMFGFPRVMQFVESSAGGEELIDVLLTDLARFVGADAEQEDDITLVTLQRTATAEMGATASEQVLADFTVPSRPGNERQVMDRVATAVEPLGLPSDRIEKLKTAVAEAAMNAIEHGNQGNAELRVVVRVVATPEDVSVLITDQGGAPPDVHTDEPDIAAKLAGLQKPRGWGLFLIKNMVDELDVTTDGALHTVRLTLRLQAEASRADA